MQKSTIQWDDVRLFLALATQGSARSAADRLKISHTTVARRVQQLETSLGTRLFDRDVRGYRLTGAGEILLQSAQATEEALMSAQRLLQGQDRQLAGNVRLTAPDVIVTYLLMPALVAFTREYPLIDIHLLPSYDVYDLSRREADIAIRIIGPGRQPPDHLIGRRLVTIASCYYGSQPYLEMHNLKRSDSAARWIGWDDNEPFPQWVRASPYPHLPAWGGINNAELQVEAARCGMGLTCLPCYIGDQCAGLVRLPDATPFDNYDIWLLTHPDLRDTARFREVRRVIVETFTAQRPLLKGETPLRADGAEPSRQPKSRR